MGQNLNGRLGHSNIINKLAGADRGQLLGHLLLRRTKQCLRHLGKELAVPLRQRRLVIVPLIFQQPNQTVQIHLAHKHIFLPIEGRNVGIRLLADSLIQVSIDGLQHLQRLIPIQ